MNSILKAAELLPAGAKAEFVLLSQAVARDRPHRTWWGLAGWFAVGWLLQEAGTSETWRRRRGSAKKKKKEVRHWISVMLLALHHLLLSWGQWLLFGAKKRTCGAMAWRAPLEAGPLRIRKALRVAGLWSGTSVPVTLLGHAKRLGTPSGRGSQGASLGTQGSLGSTGARG